MALRSDITAFLISNVGISLLLISIFTNHWASRQNKDILVYRGLFTKCVDRIHEGGKNLTCKPLPQDAEYYLMIGFLFAACGFHFVGFILGVILCWKKNINLHIGLAVIQLLVLSSAIIGLAIFAVEYDSDYFALKWSYALGWGSALCMFAALIFSIIEIAHKRRDREDRFSRYKGPLSYH